LAIKRRRKKLTEGHRRLPPPPFTTMRIWGFVFLVTRHSGYNNNDNNMIADGARQLSFSWVVSGCF